jgi:hypothetical protein
MSSTRNPIRFASAMALRIATMLGVALALAHAPSAAAQVGGTVIVKVTDEQGNPSEFVDVELKAMDNPYSRTELTEEKTGEYRFVGVPVGTYRAQAFLEGFTSDIQEFGVGPGSSRNIVLVVKKVSIEAIVDVQVYNSDLDVLDVRETTTSTTLTDKFISKVPLQNRAVEDIVALFPGVTRVGSSDSKELSIGGGNGGQIAYRVDGANANNQVDGGLAFQLPSTAIKSFKLITSGASAKYGEQSTGVAEIVTKSGENEADFAYELNFRDSDYGAFKVGELPQVQRDVDAILRANGTLLETEVRDGFRRLGVDPISTLSDDPNPPRRRRIEQTVSAGGPIVRDKAFFHVTLLSRADDFGSAFNEGVDQNDEIVETSKLNWKVWESGSRSNNLELTTNADISDNSGFPDLLASRSTNLLQTSGAWNAAVHDLHLFENKGLLDTRVQLIHEYQTSRPEDVRTGAGTQYTIPLPPAGFASYTVGAGGFNFDQSVTSLRLEGSYSRAVGKGERHNVDFGTTLEQTWFNSFTEAGDDVSDLRIVNDSGAFGGVGALVGRAATYGPPLRTDDKAWFTSLYALDTWQVTDNLTIDLGLRAEYQSFVGKAFLAPRFGFSLDPIGDKQTRFFGNWGIYYDRVFLNAIQWAQNPDQFNSDITFTSGFAQGLRRFSQTPIDEIYREALSTPEDSTQQDSVAFLTPTIHDRFVLADSLTAPTNRDWTLGISRQIPGNIRVEVSYRANKREHQAQTDAITRSLPTGGSGRTVRDRIYETTGSGAYRGWTAQIFKPFAKNWSAQLSYVQSKNLGPIQRLPNPIDPNDTGFSQGLLPNDRTHVVKLQANTIIGPGKLKINCGTDFTWQTGLPYSIRFITRDGRTFYPLGFNTQRLPCTRQLNFNLSHDFSFKTKEGGGALPTMQVRFNAFNLLDALNVTAGIGKFKTPPGSNDPNSFEPLRPDLVVTGVDVGRSVELGFSVNF